MKELKVIKLCNTCNRSHTHLPEKYKVWIDDQTIQSGKEPDILAFDFKCECGSSMFVKANLVKESTDEKVG